MISKLVSQIGESPTLAITAKAKKLIKEGQDIISFGAGEPDTDTFKNIKEAAKKSIDEGYTKYTPVPGIDELREAIVKKFKKDNNINYEKDNIIVSCGAKHSLYNAMLTILNKDDEVIIPAPYWTTYIDQVKLCWAKPVIVKTRKTDLDTYEIEKAITPKTKLIILNSPSNPSGVVYSRDAIKRVAELAVKHNIFVISDECYEKIIYDQEHYSIASFNNGVKKLTITINAVSKTYSMTGWRIGYTASEKEIITAMKNVQSQTTSNPTSISQYAALEAITGSQKKVAEMRIMFKQRRDYIYDRLINIKGVQCRKPEGAFYIFPDISKFYNKEIKNSLDMASVLLDKAKVAVIPGSAFGADNCIRLSYATPMDKIKEGLNRIEKFFNSLK